MAHDVREAQAMSQHSPEGLARTTAAMIREAREAAGVSQTELARRLGIGQSAVVRMEDGRHVARLDTLHGIAAALDLDIVCEFRRRRRPGRNQGPNQGMVLAIASNMPTTKHGP